MKNNLRQKVLIVSQFYIPDITAAAYRINDMYEAIKDRFEIDIVTTYPHKSNAVADASAEQNIYRVRITNNNRNRVIRYLSEYFSFMIQSILLSKKLQKQYNFVFVTSPPIFVLISGYIISRLKKSKLIVDIRDIWPDVLLDDGTLTENNIIFKMLKHLEKFIYKKSDAITCVSKYMADYIAARSGKQVSVIYNGISNDVLIENPHRNKAEKLTLFYTGNIGFFQHMDVLIDAFCDQYIQDKFKVTIIGGGASFSKISKDVNERGLTHVITFIQPMEKKLLNKKVADEADLLFFNLYDSITLRRTIPSKLFDYLGFNLPIVYGIKGEGKELLDYLGCGTYFEWNNANSLKYALIDLYDRYGEYKEKSKYNCKYVYDNFDRIKMFGIFWEGMGESKVC